MDISLEIPSEKSRDFSPLQSIDIDLNEEDREELHYETVQSTNHMPFTSTPFKKKTKESKMSSFWIIRPKDEVYLSDSEEENMMNASSYKMILLRDQNSNRLIQRFLQESSTLRKSKVQETDYSIEACFNRLASYGYRVMLVNYKTLEIEEITVKVNHLDVEWHRGTSATSVSFEKLSGIILGDTSSTFKMYKNQGGNLGKYSIQSTDCLSVLSDFRSFDFATTDDQAKYDIYTVISWKISVNASKGSIIPLGRGKIATFKIRMKLEEIARSKCLFVNELLLLAIFKVLVQTEASHDKVDKIKKMLDSKLKLDQKMFRMSQRMKPRNFQINMNFLEKFDNSQRALELRKRMYNKIVFKDPQILHFINTWNIVKHHNSVGYNNFKALLSRKMNKNQSEITMSPEQKIQKTLTKLIA